MAQFQVDSEQVIAANATIQATISRLQQEVSSLHSQLQQMVAMLIPVYLFLIFNKFS